MTNILTEHAEVTRISASQQAQLAVLRELMATMREALSELHSIKLELEQKRGTNEDVQRLR